MVFLYSCELDNQKMTSKGKNSQGFLDIAEWAVEFIETQILGW